MPKMDLPKTFLVIDNGVLVQLNESFCDLHLNRLVLNRVIPDIEQWIVDFLEIIRKFTLDSYLHCTRCVAEEFRPQAGRLSQRAGIRQSEIQQLQHRVCSRLQQSPADIPRSQSLRNLPQAPKNLIGPGRLSDNDLSLVDLALQLTRNGQPVYILSNDQDLIDFASWLRTKGALFPTPINPSRLQAWRSLTYFELIHRSCNIKTDPMRELILFALRDHYSRSELAGTTKGQVIFQTLVEINDQFTRSIELKLQNKAAAI